MEQDIIIHVTPHYRPDDSDIAQNRYAFSYHITIQNQSDDMITLRRRTWHITDAYGKVEQVQGIGVVGEQPTLFRGDSFEYQSGAMLSTPYGSMEGSYEFETSHGERFSVDIPRFELKSECGVH